MRNIYFVQANDVYIGKIKTTYIPYAAGCILAYCKQNKEIAKNYRFQKIIYSRLPIDELVLRLDNPFSVLFSCSVWNTEYNKRAAQEIKKQYPDCKIIFGGHNISSGGEFLETYNYIDCLVHRFGEEPTEGLLEAFIGLRSLESIANISYRDGTKVITTNCVPQTGIHYPSPYLTGVFDDVLEDDIEFSAIFETNRGCPNSCTYCDWGALKSKVRLFPMERVKAELDWFVEHKIEFIFCADGNFCLFSRDVEIAEYVVELKKKYGYPQAFRVCFTKNKLDLVFKIGSMFYEHDLDKAQTLSFQSMDETTLNNVGRKNISTKSFQNLMKKYNGINIATFSEMILGLPGETYESFCNGIGTLLENGQHFSVFIYPCMILPNSEMGQKWYLEKYQITGACVPFELVHTQKQKNKDIMEYAVYVTSTYSMCQKQWIDSLIFSKYIQALHTLGLLRYVALFCRHEYAMPYSAFYQVFIAYSKQKQGGVLNRVFQRVNSLCEGVAKSENAFSGKFTGLGDVLWEMDELIFFEFFTHLEEFYEQTKACFEDEYGSGEMIDALFRYQYDVIKKIGLKEITISSEYDFYTYFNNILQRNYSPLKKKPIKFIVKDEAVVSNLEEYARVVIWYGRNKRLTDYSSSFYKPNTVFLE